MGFRSENMTAILDAIGSDNANKEFYLTDAVTIARDRQLGTDVIVCAEDEVLGVNSRDQLAEAERIAIERALGAGANEYVMKPFTQDVIADKLRMLGLLS